MTVSTTYCYQAATHLNNTAVSLLLNQCFEQAARTLSDAVQLIKLSSSATQQQNETLGSWVQDKLQKASQRLSNPNPSKSISSISFQVISDDESPKALCTSADAACLVHMEPFMFEENPTEEDLSIPASIIFYNHGIAYRCLAASADSCRQQRAREIQKGAFQMFKLAMEIASRHACRVHTLLTLQNLVDLSHRLDLESKERRNHYAFRLRYELQSLQAMEVALPPRHARPARAA